MQQCVFITKHKRKEYRWKSKTGPNEWSDSVNEKIRIWWGFTDSNGNGNLIYEDHGSKQLEVSIDVWVEILSGNRNTSICLNKHDVTRLKSINILRISLVSRRQISIAISSCNSICTQSVFCETIQKIYFTNLMIPIKNGVNSNTFKRWLLPYNEHLELCVPCFLFTQLTFAKIHEIVVCYQLILIMKIHRFWFKKKKNWKNNRIV